LKNKYGNCFELDIKLKVFNRQLKDSKLNEL